jgi:phosphoribosyl 1,2-cyclic phosphodiesterase
MGFRFRLLASGSSGNATLIEAGETRLLIDGGLGPRILAGRLRALDVEPDSLSAILLTHEHVDHIKGVAAFARRWGVLVAGSRGTRRAGGFAELALELPGFDLVRPAEARDFGAVSVTPVAIPHDAAGPLAFVLRVGEATLGHATDVGHLTDDLALALEDCDALAIESNHDFGMLRTGPYPWALKERIAGPHGHLSNTETARFLAARLGSRCRTVVLAHLSRTNNHPEVARATVEPALARAGRGDVAVEVADPDGTPCWIEVHGADTDPEGPALQGRLW